MGVRPCVAAPDGIDRCDLPSDERCRLSTLAPEILTHVDVSLFASRARCACPVRTTVRTRVITLSDRPPRTCRPPDAPLYLLFVLILFSPIFIFTPWLSSPDDLQLVWPSPPSDGHSPSPLRWLPFLPTYLPHVGPFCAPSQLPLPFWPLALEEHPSPWDASSPLSLHPRCGDLHLHPECL